MKSEKNELRRIDFLDYTRGLASIGVMFFHYYSWVFRIENELGFINRIGLYAVAIFYILSGMTLYKVYIEAKVLSYNNLKNFYIKRFFRIYPLMWLVISLYLLFIISDIDINIIILNYTGLFGILDWGHPIGTGVWSIGNELCFYLLFPFFWLIISKNKTELLITIVFVLNLYFSFFYFDQSKTLSEQWINYVNPFNQLFMFVAGIGIGFYSSKYLILMQTKWMYTILFILVFILFFIPVQGYHELNLVTGFNRYLFTFLAIGICFISIHLPPILNKTLHSLFKTIGEASYSIYLLHPLAFYFVFEFTENETIRVFNKLLLSVFLTFFLSLISYYCFEKKLVDFGNKIIRRKSITYK